jgi:putative endonuclease
MDHLSIGQLGEDIACKYLESKNYRIIERNHRKPWGEIDIISKSLDGTLVFIEVKTLKAISGGIQPEDNMSNAKIIKTKRACQIFAEEHASFVNERKGWRIDLIAITVADPEQAGESERLTDILKYCTINQYENI